MSIYTADSLVEAAMLDQFPRPAVCQDFGIDLNRDLFGIYQQKIRNGEITQDQLRVASRAEHSGKALSELLGVKVETVFDSMPSAE